MVGVKTRNLSYNIIITWRLNLIHAIGVNTTDYRELETLHNIICTWAWDMICTNHSGTKYMHPYVSGFSIVSLSLNKHVYIIVFIIMLEHL